MSVQLVGRGIDTVKINVRRLGEDGKPAHVQMLPGSFEEDLQTWQDKAKITNKPEPTSLPPFHGARLKMWPNSAPAWKYILRNDCIEIKLCPRLNLSMVAKITLLSLYLWTGGEIETVIDEVHTFLITHLGQDLMLQVAQLDLCADVVGLSLPTEWERVFVTHAIRKSPIGASQKDQAYYQGRKLETLMFSGHGRPVNAKIYNKTLEIRQHARDKVWFHDIWSSNDWQGIERLPSGEEIGHVWRVECAVERPGFLSMKIEDIYDALRNLKRIWAYCTREWLRMVVPCSDSNRTRWPTHPDWILIQNAFDDAGCKMSNALGPLARERKRQANLEQGVAALAGYVTTVAAWDEVLDGNDDPNMIFSIIYDHVTKRWQRLKVFPQDLVREKRMLYNREQ